MLATHEDDRLLARYEELLCEGHRPILELAVVNPTALNRTVRALAAKHGRPVPLPTSGRLRPASDRPIIISGYAAIFGALSGLCHDEDSEADRWKFLPGAFTDSLTSGAPVVANIGHTGYPLAATHNDSLALREDGKGLHFTSALRDTPVNRQLAASVSGGTVGCSVRFHFKQTRLVRSSGEVVREILAADLEDVCFTETPRFPQTSAQVERWWR